MSHWIEGVLHAMGYPGVGNASDDCGCAYLRSLPRHLVLDLGSDRQPFRVLLVHGSPRRAPCPTPSPAPRGGEGHRPAACRNPLRGVIRAFGQTAKIAP